MESNERQVDHGGKFHGILGHRHHSHTMEQGLPAEQGIRAVKVSLGGLMATAGLQVLVVLASGSVALMADTVHNVADALTALPLWLAFRLSKLPPNRRFTYGYGRAEDLAGLFIVGVIAFSAGVTAWQSVERLLDPRPVSNLGWVAAAAVVGLLGNEAVAAYRIRVGKRIGSAALVADGLHARTDGLTSLGVLVGALGVAAGWQWADPLVGLIITAAILLILKHAGADVYVRLMEGVSPDLVDEAHLALNGVPGVEGVNDLRMRWTGHSLRAEAKIVVDCDKSLTEAHRIAEDAHHRLLHAFPSLREALIHVDPCGHDGKDPHAGIQHHFGA